jgi:GDP-mannose 6-dehydrogenase
VGCVTAACLARDGHRVIGVDINRDKVAAINAGRSPVAEPGLDELLGDEVRAGHLFATDDVESAVRATEIAMVTVGTPSAEDGSIKLDAVFSVVEAIGRALRDTDQAYTIVLRSTLLPGVLEEQLAPRLADACGDGFGTRVVLCNNPEFLRESSAIADYDEPPYVVVGKMEDANVDAVTDLYASVAAEKIVTDTRTAALVKYACNAFHATKIAFANEIGSLAQSFGGDGRSVMELVCRDEKLNISTAYLRPGFAFGGSCLPKDLRAITRYAEQQALRLNLLQSVLPANDSHLRRGIDRVLAAGKRRIGLVGLSFKAGTDDLRESPAVILAESLLGKGADLKIFDPGISLSRLAGRNLAYVDSHLPHLAKLLVANESHLLEHSELVVLCSGVADALASLASYQGIVIDLRKDLVAQRI